MYTSILIPIALDHNPLATQKLQTARHMLAPGGAITLLTVLEQIPGFTAEFVTVKSENKLTEKVLSSLKTLGGGAEDVTCKIATGKPGMVITEVAKDIGADLVIVGAHHPSAMDYLLGSTAARVSRRAPCSVLIQRPHA